MDNKKERTKNMILYVLVIYRGSVGTSRSFRTLLASEETTYPHIFVYDNSSDCQQTNIAVGAYFHDPSNSGVSKAYNTAYEYALKNGYDWLLLLDEDTTFPIGALAKYQKAIENTRQEMIVPQHQIQTGQYLSPTKRWLKSSDLQSSVPTGIVKYEDATPINSGMLVSTKSFGKAGKYDEKVWLDFSDVRFIEKYKRHYNTYYVMPDVVCKQDFSGLETNSETIMARYHIYLECAANYPKDSLADAMSMTLTTLRPTLSRSIKERTFKYLKAYWNIYILKRRDSSTKIFC